MTSILGIAGGVVAAGGHVLAGQMQAGVLRANAKQAERDADQARLAARVDIEDIESAGEAVRSTQRAVTAAQGTRTDEGSPLVLAMEAARAERKVVLRRRYIGELEATKLETEAIESRKRAHQVQVISGINAVATALSAASTASTGAGV